MRAVTGVAATDVLTTAVNHGYEAGERVVFKSLVGGTGLVAGTTYYVIAAGLTARDFKVSATLGGAAVDVTADLTSGLVRRYFTGGKRFVRTGGNGTS